MKFQRWEGCFQKLFGPFFPINPVFPLWTTGGNPRFQFLMFPEKHLSDFYGHGGVTHPVPKPPQSRRYAANQGGVLAAQQYFHIISNDGFHVIFFSEKLQKFLNIAIDFKGCSFKLSSTPLQGARQ